MGGRARPQDGAGKAGAVRAYAQFQAELRAYSAECDESVKGWREKFAAGSRKAPDWPLWKTNPKYHECSISV